MECQCQEMPGFLEYRSGSRPSETGLSERHSGAFHHKNTPGYMYVCLQCDRPAVSLPGPQSGRAAGLAEGCMSSRSGLDAAARKRICCAGNQTAAIKPKATMYLLIRI
jgi:hypothetical protein